MKKFNTRFMVFLILSIIGMVVAVHSVILKNSVLLIASILFAAVSTYNIFCK